MERLHRRSVALWNTAPGALVVRPEFSQRDSTDFPFYWRRQTTDLRTTGPLVNGTVPARRLVNGTDADGLLPPPWFTALLYVTVPGPVTSSSVVYRLIKAVGRSRHLRKVRTVLLLFLFLTFENTGCPQLLEITWNLKLLLEILEISWNLVDSPVEFYNL